MIDEGQVLVLNGGGIHIFLFHKHFLFVFSPQHLQPLEMDFIEMGEDFIEFIDFEVEQVI